MVVESVGFRVPSMVHEPAVDLLGRQPHLGTHWLGEGALKVML